MFRTKKQKLCGYIAEQTGAGALSPFDTLLAEYLSGAMKEKLLALGLKKVRIHIDWLPDYRCINVQAVLGALYVDLQIEPGEFSLAADPDEPDEHIVCPLEAAEQVYAALKQLPREAAR